MSEALARTHIDRFNAAVTGGDWSELLADLHPDAVMTFVGVPAGPYQGRDAIAAAYETNPPDDTMRVVSVHSDADHDIVAFEWSGGGTGTLTIRRDARLITALTIQFD